jgi:butyryl-CoA dehydrogenase
VIAEAVAFAEAVGLAADRVLVEPEPWRPGAIQDDRCGPLADALGEIGWHDLAADPSLLPLAGPAALELGRRLAPLSEIDALLGGSPLAGDLVRYGAARAVGAPAATPTSLAAVTPRSSAAAPRSSAAAPPPSPAAAPPPSRALNALVVYAVERAEPLPYGDALGVHRVLACREIGVADGAAVAAWIAAGVGYLAGLCEWALDVALDHARGRRAFGTTLAGLAPVQQRLADAATAARGLRLLAHDSPGRAALAHAGTAAVEVTAACQQVTGAIGFTLEFPLQRAYRRARAIQLWADALIAPAR